MNEWMEYPKTKPRDGEPVLVLSLTNGNTSVVQFGKLFSDHGVDRWELFDPTGVGVITHWIKIPEFPLIHRNMHGANAA